ncbi:MAG: histidinol dehydrogenase [Bacteroidales bacterium]|nr:histidinol dehydrogenase [Bacteroidales bacterium]
MKIFDHPAQSQWAELCARTRKDDPQVAARVDAILERVRTEGDAALQALSLEIDRRPLAVQPGEEGLPLEVPASDIAAAAARVRPEVRAAIVTAASHIRAFHEAQLPREIVVETAPGVRCIQRPVPIERVGLYIPGGTAPLFSTVLMLAIPAAIAGCPEVILCTPAGPDGNIAPEVLYAASYCGIRRIFCLGGAQAVAAMAFGTRTVPKVDKIFGPGNRYVTTAKQRVAGSTVAIDMPAGPSEVMVIADEQAQPAFVAADLLSQAEHGADSQVMLVCPSRRKAEAVVAEVERQRALLPRADFAAKALENSRAVILDKLDDIVAFADTYAPEHLIVNTREPWTIADRVRAAGSVFVGAWTPESAGDYASGTNHTLPTSGWARSFSGVNLDSFLRKMTLQEISREGLQGLAPTITAMAEAEGLDAHARAVTTRLAAAGDSLSPGSAEEQAAIRRVVNLVRENIAQLAPYSTARDEYSGPVGIFLDANESPYPTGWNRYPDPHQKVLKEKISAIKGVPVQSIFLGNGSDEAIDLVFRVFCTPGRDNVVAIAPSYGMYSVAAATNDISLHTVLLGKDFSLPVEALAAATDSRSKVLFLCSPNNPSGNAFPQEQLIEVIRRFPGMVVVDEAYADFSTKGSLLPRLAELPNLIVLQTFSKAYGLAGLRLGLAYAHPYVIRLMSQVKYPYNINQSTQLLAMKALETPIEPYVREILAQRERLVEELPKLPCVRKVWPSDANFLLVEFSDADATYAHLLADGIIVRNRSRVPLCAGCLRLTVGLPEENDRLLASLQRLCHLQKTE